MPYASASEMIPPLDVPTIRSKCSPVRPPPRSSRVERNEAVNRPRIPPPSSARTRKDDPPSRSVESLNLSAVPYTSVFPSGGSSRSDGEALRDPGEAQLRRRRHVAGESGRGHHGGAGEISLAADAHTILPVAVEGGDGALPRPERIGALAEAGTAP